MAGFKCKQCRRLGQSVCGRENCAIRRKPYPPGVHGKRRRRVSEYGQQLLEKQKLKLIYGVREKQFRNYFQKAALRQDLTGQTLLSLLEKRLDNVVWRLGITPTRRQARQLVSHGHFMVNGRRVTVPSYQIRKGDTVTMRERSKQSPLFKDLLVKIKKYNPPVWLEIDKDSLSGKVLADPDEETLKEVPVEVAQIVEFYSR